MQQPIGLLWYEPTRLTLYANYTDIYRAAQVDECVLSIKSYTNIGTNKLSTLIQTTRAGKYFQIENAIMGEYR